jgi:hypothetical protein
MLDLPKLILHSVYGDRVKSYKPFDIGYQYSWSYRLKNYENCLNAQVMNPCAKFGKDS